MERNDTYFSDFRIVFYRLYILEVQKREKKDFKSRLNKRGEEYGWSVAIMTPPEYLWGYKFVTGRYKESPEESFRAIEKQIGKYFDLDGKSLKKIL